MRQLAIIGLFVALAACRSDSTPTDAGRERFGFGFVQPSPAIAGSGTNPHVQMMTVAGTLGDTPSTYNGSNWAVGTTLLIDQVLALGTTTTDTLTGTQQDNYSKSGLSTSTVLDLTLTANTTISGIVAPAIAGTILDVRNVRASTGTLTVLDESTSTSANQFGMPGATTWKLPPGTSMLIRYNGTKWFTLAAVTTEFPTLTVDGAAFGDGGQRFFDVAGFGLLSTANSVFNDPTVMQQRVGSACAPPNSLAAIAQNGSATCTTRVRAASAPCLAGTLAEGDIDNWTNSCLVPDAIVEVEAADNAGSTLVGINATGFSLGDRLTICNTNAPQDDAILAFQAEGSSSGSANRIWTPNYGRNSGQTSVERATTGPSGCRTLMRIQPDQADPTTVRWVLDQSGERQAASISKLLELYPYSTPAAITGTVNDWDPVDACLEIGGPVAGSCESASNPASSTYTAIQITTVSSTGATVGGIKYTSSSFAEGQGPIKWLLNNGPGNVTLVNGCGGGSSASLNQFCFTPGGSNLGNIVLVPGQSAPLVWHQRDTGYWTPMGPGGDYFTSRDVNMTKGLEVSGGGAGGYSTATLVVPSGSSNGVYFGYGGAIPFHYVQATDAAYSGVLEIGTTLTVSGGAFTGVALQHICDGRAPTSVSAGSAEIGSTDCIGRITGIGSASTKLTFAGTGATNSAECFLTLKSGGAAQLVTSDDNAATPTFSCLSSATGSAANCPDISYNCWWH